MQLVSEGLFRGHEIRIFAASGICRKNRGTGEAEQVILPEHVRDSLMHIAELRPVALIKDDDHMLVVDRMFFIPANEIAQLLYRRDDDLCLRIGQLSC